jgi:hypothetical protein
VPEAKPAKYTRQGEVRGHFASVAAEKKSPHHAQVAKGWNWRTKDGAGHAVG